LVLRGCIEFLYGSGPPRTRRFRSGGSFHLAPGNANVLLVAECRKRISKAQSRRFVELLRTLPIAVDDVSVARAWDGVLSLAREQQLSAYDAAYLELAMREGLPIATLDNALRKAARSCGVAVR